MLKKYLASNMYQETAAQFEFELDFASIKQPPLKRNKEAEQYMVKMSQIFAG